MILSVMAFLVVVSAFAAGAAWLADRGLQGLGLPGRFVWAGALALGPALLAIGALPAVNSVAGGAAASLPLGVIDVPGLVVGGADTGSGVVIALAAGFWIASTLVFALMLVRARVLLGRDASQWKPERVLGRDVLVAGSLGPAVAGTLRPRIVLPGWVLALPERQLRMVLMHEEEHLRAGDARLLGAALAVVAATAWNPVSWWLFRRLRTAIEIDCDRRVLRRKADPMGYGESLLAVAARASRPSLALAAFTESPHALERRIVAMTARATRRTRVTGALLVAAAVVLGVQACGVDSPVSYGAGEAEDPNISDVPAEIAAEPTFTPFTVAPEIVNREEVIRAMASRYPPLLREAGVEGTVRVYFLISATGRVAEVRLDQSSGHEALDEAALAVAAVYRFAPALNREEPVPVWVSFPITFQAGR
ncbi:MAG: M56 family metallopeptidase [Gemmatimonadota bacterium]